MVRGSDPLERYMLLAIAQAETSLRIGNHGFGAVVIKNGDIVAQEHDSDETDRDPTAHAELKAIRKASSLVGMDLSACALVCTHEPCPMCSGAIVWSRIGLVAYGYGIVDAIAEGRDRIDVNCEEIFSRSRAAVRLQKGLLKERCAVLYDRRVREEIQKLRNASDEVLATYDLQSRRKRLQWYSSRSPESSSSNDPLADAYRLLLDKLGIPETEAPVVHKDRGRIVFHSVNYCPTLEACKILQLDTRRVCRLYNEGATQVLIRQIDSRLSFTRNYEMLRPQSEYCEEQIEYRREGSDREF